MYYIDISKIKNKIKQEQKRLKNFSNDRHVSYFKYWVFANPLFKKKIKEHSEDSTENVNLKEISIGKKIKNVKEQVENAVL